MNILDVLEKITQEEAIAKPHHEFSVELIKLIRKIVRHPNCDEAIETAAVMLLSIMAGSNPDKFDQVINSIVLRALLSGEALERMSRRK